MGRKSRYSVGAGQTERMIVERRSVFVVEGGRRKKRTSSR